MRVVVQALVLSVISSIAFAGGYPYAPAGLNDVKVTGGFWLARIETNRLVTVKTDFRKCEETGRIANFERAARREKGGFKGVPWDDSDVFKVIEGAAYTLAQHPDPELDRYLDNLIAQIAGAQEPDGYLYTARTLVKAYAVEAFDGKEWITLATETRNTVRHRIHKFQPRTVTAVRIRIDETWGDPSARVFEVRVY